MSKIIEDDSRHDKGQIRRKYQGNLGMIIFQQECFKLATSLKVSGTQPHMY